MFEQTDRGIDFANGTGRELIDFDEEPKDSRGYITSPKEEFFVAFEPRGNPQDGVRFRGSRIGRVRLPRPLPQFALQSPSLVPLLGKELTER